MLSRPTEALLQSLSSVAQTATSSDVSLLPLSPSEWGEFYMEARRQTVQGVILEYVKQLPDELLPPDSILLRWLAEAAALEARSRAVNRSLVSLLAFFNEAGLRPVLQKGPAAARFYPNPLLRACGDIDLWLPTEEFAESAKMLDAKGLKFEKRPDGSVNFVHEGVVVELHDQLFDVAKPGSRQLIDNQVEFCEVELAEGIRVRVPSPPFEVLMLSLHVMKHAFSVGVGLRQILDYTLACKKLNANGLAQYESLVRQLGLEKWTEMLDSMLDRDAKPTRLLDVVVEGGNFGRHGRNHRRGKLATAMSFLKRSRLSMSVAPGEALHSALSLIKGNLK